MKNLTPLIRITFIITTYLIFTKPLISQIINNGGFETGDLTSWIDVNTGDESISTFNARTGEYCLSYSTNNANNQRMENNTSFVVPASSYLHCIGWVVGENSDACASLTINLSSWRGMTNQNIGTSLTQLSWRRQNSGTEEITNAQVGVNSKKLEDATTLYWDDIIAYVSTNSETDLTNPNPPSLVDTESNEVGTTIIVTWTDGTDDGEGSIEALILRSEGTTQTPPTLNNQGLYSTTDGSDGPNSVGAWDVVGIVELDVQTFSDNTTIPNTEYTYAVYMRDIAYNYSSGSSSSVQALPVELTSFTAQTLDDAILLRWETATEVNNYGFEVQRNTPHFPPSRGDIEDRGVWRTLAFVIGHGNSNSPRFYQHIDNNTQSAGTYYYRLKQIDYDGAYEYSNEISIYIEPSQNLILCNNYPNPFNSQTTIFVELPVDSKINLSIYNVLGEHIATLADDHYIAGKYKFNFDAETIPSGVYFYRLTSTDKILTRKMLLTK